MLNKTEMSYHCISTYTGYNQRQKIQSVGKNVENLRPSFTDGRNVKSYSYIGKHLTIFQKTKHNFSIRPINSTFWKYWEWGRICMSMQRNVHRFYSSIIHSSQKLENIITVVSL